MAYDAHTVKATTTGQYRKFRPVNRVVVPVFSIALMTIKSVNLLQPVYARWK